MIRINLLATERRAAKAAAPGFQAGQKMMVIGSLMLVLTAVGVGWRFWALGQQKTEVVRQIELSKREEARLQEILKQVEEFQNRRKMLEARVALIDELRKGQTAPVHMIDQVSRALPDMTWLTVDPAEQLHADHPGPLPHADVVVGLHRQPRSVALLHSSGRDHRELGHSRRRRRARADPVHDSRHLPDVRR